MAAQATAQHGPSAPRPIPPRPAQLKPGTGQSPSLRAISGDPPDAPGDLFTCVIDSEDRILEFGIGEGNLAVTASGIDPAWLGSNLYAHVSGHFTRRFLQAFLMQIRSTGQPAQRVYRCDSPGSRCLMEMRAIPEGDGRLRLEHRLLDKKDFDYRVEVKTAPRRGLAHYLRCTNCARMRPIRSGIWREPEDYVQPDCPAHVVHTICPSCRSGVAVHPLVHWPPS